MQKGISLTGRPPVPGQGPEPTKPRNASAGRNHPAGPPSVRILKSRERILAACAVQFALRGYHGVSTRELAREAQVNEVTLFRHFPNKVEIYRAVVTTQLDGLEVRDEFLTQISKSRNVREAISNSLKAMEDTLALSPLLGRLLQYSFLEGGPFPAEDLRSRLERALRPIRIALEVWMEAAEAPSLDVEQTILGILAQVVVRQSMRTLMVDDSILMPMLA